MTDGRSLTDTDLMDIVNGGCLYGAGGGGPWTLGESLAKDIVESGKPVVLAETSTMPPTATTCVSAGFGSPDAAAGGFPFDVTAQAFDALADGQQQPFGYVLPAEIGAANSIVPMTVAAVNGIPILDAAGSFRAVPTLSQSTFATTKAPIGTIVLADEHRKAQFPGKDPETADEVMRVIVSGGFFPGAAGVALWAMDGTAVASATIPGTTEAARALGATLREARAAGQNPVEAVRAALGGKVLITGTIESAGEKTTGGFDLGIVTFTDGQHTLQVVNQNENMLAWNDTDAHPVALAPDLICFMTTDGQPFSNADLELAQGKEVAVIGAPADESMRTAAMIDAFIPLLRGAGYGGPYVPIEDLGGVAAAA